VIAPQLQSIAIAPTSLDVTAGTSSPFNLTALYNDGSTQEVTAGSNWTSDSASIASVGTSGLASGRVSGIIAGPATINASYGGLTKSAFVTVRTRALKDLTITGVFTAIVGNQVALTAMASYTDGTSKDVTSDTSWSIDKTNVAILADPLNQPGQIVMVDGGQATLTASFGNLTKTVTLISQGL
jgi:hypothetical protein